MKLLLALVFVPLFAKALDLTPEATFRDLEGFRIPILHFTDAGRKISFQPPPKWRVSGGGAALSLFPPGLADAVLLLRVHPRKPLAAGETEDLEKWCRTQVPRDATQLTIDGQTASPFTLGTVPSRAVTYSYAAQGRRCTTTVAVVDWTARERLAVVVTARTTDFPATYEAAMRSMFSWSPQ